MFVKVLLPFIPVALVSVFFVFFTNKPGSLTSFRGVLEHTFCGREASSKNTSLRVAAVFLIEARIKIIFRGGREKAYFWVTAIAKDALEWPETTRAIP